MAIQLKRYLHEVQLWEGCLNPQGGTCQLQHQISEMGFVWIRMVLTMAFCLGLIPQGVNPITLFSVLNGRSSFELKVLWQWLRMYERWACTSRVLGSSHLALHYNTGDATQWPATMMHKAKLHSVVLAKDIDSKKMDFAEIRLRELGVRNEGWKDNILTLKVLVATTDAQWEGMGDVGSARYEPVLLPPCPTIRVLSYSN